MRRPSEKITVRLFPHRISYLLSLLDQQEDAAARRIAEQLRYDDLQHRIKMQQWEKSER